VVKQGLLLEVLRKGDPKGGATLRINERGKVAKQAQIAVLTIYGN
jgi:hypothetical protein